MKLALITLVMAGLAVPAVSRAQAQHAAAPAPAPHVSSAPTVAPAPAVRTSTAHTSASHQATATSTGAPSSNHPRSSSVGSYTPWPTGSYFTGPVSPGGFVNPLAGTNKGNQSKGTTGIILLGGGYGYGYAYDDSGNNAQVQADAQADDQESGGQQSGGQSQPQYIFVQQVPDPRGSSGSSTSREESLAAPEDQPALAASLRDVGSFTLVTQAGYHLEAVAFTRSSDRLIYITPDGGRRTIAFRDLDVDATQRLNTELGTPITIPTEDDATPPTNKKTKPSPEIVN